MTDHEQDSRSKKIFYFEDDTISLEDYFEELKKEYLVEFGAGAELVQHKREFSFDLVLLDIMIHTQSPSIESVESGNPKSTNNIAFEEFDWTQVGIEFLRQIREGKYEQSGFDRHVPVIVVSAVVDDQIKNIMRNLEIAEYLEKPFTVEGLKTTVKKVLSSEEKQES